MMKASSLIETIVASTIFLILFSISMQTVVQLTAQKESIYIKMERQQQLNTLFAKYTKVGEYYENYDWGTVTIIVRPYKVYEDLIEITVKMERKELKRIVRRNESNDID